MQLINISRSDGSFMELNGVFARKICFVNMFDMQHMDNFKDFLMEEEWIIDQSISSVLAKSEAKKAAKMLPLFLQERGYKTGITLKVITGINSNETQFLLTY